MSDRQTPESRLHALTDPHASIVEADGAVRPTDTRPIPGWQNHAGGATRGVKEYRGDQHAGVDNSVQAAQGCRLAAGVSDGADLCTLGTADLQSAYGGYSTLDWACNQIRVYEATYNERPDCLLLTETQARGLLESVAVVVSDTRTPDEQMDAVRRGEVYLLGVPLKLFEVAHG